MTAEPMRCRRLAFVVRLRPEKKEHYLALHADVWPGVVERMSRHNIRNYSIFLCDDVLFSYSEYTGVDFDRDMAEMAAHPESREWARLTDECQIPFAPEAPPSGLWTQAVEVFHVA